MQATAELRNAEYDHAASNTCTSDAATAWLTPGRFALFLGLLVFASFPGVLLGKTTFVFRDFAMFSYPVAFYHKECFWRGEIPLWNPYNYCGIPFLAQWNTMVLYPLSLIYLLLPLTWSLPFFCLAHMWWGGLGMYFLAHRWTGNRLAAGLAGVVFSFNGLMQNFLMWPSHAATFGWMPWVLWLVPEGWRTGGRKLVLAVTVASMQMLAGGPETILFTWVLLLLLAAGEWLAGIRAKPESGLFPIHAPLRKCRHSAQDCEPRAARRRPAIFRISDFGFLSDFGLRVSDFCRRGRWRSCWAILMRFVCIAGLVFLVCAAQLLPFVELLLNSSRDARTASAGFDWPMPLWGWANFLVPMFRTVPSSQGVFFQLQQNWTSSYYAGIGTVFFAGIAIWRSKDWRVKMLAGTALVAGVLAFGDPGFVYRVLRACVPAFGFVRYPVKFVIPVLAVVPLLAAIGLQHLLVGGGRKRSFEWCSAVAILILIAAIMGFDWKYPIPEDIWHLTTKNGLTRSCFLVLSVLSILAVVKSRGYRQPLCGVLLIFITWYDLVTHVPNQNPTARPEIYAEGWAKAQLTPHWLPQLGQGRLMLAPAADETLRYHALPAPDQDASVKRAAFFCDANLLDEVPQAYGFFSLVPGHIADLVNLPYVRTNLPVSRILDFMAVSRTTAPGMLSDWVQRPTAMPLVTAGQNPMYADDRATVAELLQTNIDLRSLVLLPVKARASVRVRSQVPARVLKTLFRRDRVLAQVETPAPSLVLIAQSYYPAWKAYVDSKPATVYRANYAFQALEVPSGRHEILLKYQDGPLVVGAFLSCLGLMLTCLWWVVAKRGFRFPRPVASLAQMVNNWIQSS